MLATVIECVDLDAEVAFFVDEVGLRIHLVSPADDPRRVVLESSMGARLELHRGDVNRAVRILVEGATGQTVISPGGSVVEIRSEPERPVVGASMPVPTNATSLTVVDGADGSFGLGRAGMHYRDLLPDRWGGRFIASHIRIDDGGDVADWVHFHRVRFQMIYVASGWVDVVYEGMGEPFRMHAGDCVLQPPEIRHRVLRSSAGLEVIEIGCPAEHDTIADHDLELPTPHRDPDRDFSGQRFVRHVAAAATAAAWIDPSLVARDTGIGAATSGLAGAVVVGPSSFGLPGCELVHHGEFAMVVGVAGVARIDVGSRSVSLTKGTSIAVPQGVSWRWSVADVDHQALVVALPHDAVERS